jgi:hypothetical protein
MSKYPFAARASVLTDPRQRDQFARFALRSEQFEPGRLLKFVAQR